MKLRKKAFVSFACTLALIGNSFGVIAQDNARKIARTTSDGQTKVSSPEANSLVFAEQNAPDVQLRINQETAGFNFAPQDNIMVRGQYLPGQEATFNFVSSEMSFDSKLVKGAPF